MIIVYHNKKIVLEILDTESDNFLSFNKNQSISKAILEISEKYPNTIIFWCNEKYKAYFNKDEVASIFHHKLIMASYSLNKNYLISNKIGYVEQTPFVNVTKDVSFPTWLMSSDIGGCYSLVLNKLKAKLYPIKNFDYFLCSLAKKAMPKGVFCYSEPKLIKGLKLDNNTVSNKQSNFYLFSFVKEHYKPIWLFNLLLCFVFFEKQFPFFSFLRVLLKTQSKIDDLNFVEVELQSTKQVINNKQYDVVIPTLGREAFLYDVLKDLAKQTICPKNVIIVEQNPEPQSKTSLDYLTSEKWPFNIDHTFTHKLGVCNARNSALNKVKSEWVFLGDDDIRFEKDLIENFFNQINAAGVRAVIGSCLLPNQKKNHTICHQTTIFASGASMIKSELLNYVSFDMSFEFGFGEDSDFGMQIRKTGEDVIYSPKVDIVHLKAKIGGFRVKQPLLWGNEKIQPVPSPTLMALYKKHYNSYQLLGAKFVFFMKSYKKNLSKNPLKFIRNLNEKWGKSEYWSSVLMTKK